MIASLLTRVRPEGTYYKDERKAVVLRVVIEGRRESASDSHKSTRACHWQRLRCAARSARRDVLDERLVFSDIGAVFHDPAGSNEVVGRVNLDSSRTTSRSDLPT